MSSPIILMVGYQFALGGLTIDLVSVLIGAFIACVVLLLLSRYKAKKLASKIKTFEGLRQEISEGHQGLMIANKTLQTVTNLLNEVEYNNAQNKRRY